MAKGFPLSYTTDICPLESGRRNGIVPFFRIFAKCASMACDHMMGAGISSFVSFDA